MASTVFYSFAKAMFKSSSGNIEIPNFQSPQIKYIFELPFEFRIAVAFIGFWVGFVAFDNVTDIVGRKYMWILGLMILVLISYIIKQYVGIGPSSEDIVALFDEDRDAIAEMLSKNWKLISSHDVLKQAIGKPVVIQWVSQQYGHLYLTDEKKPYFTFAKRVEHAGNFQLIAAPMGNGANTIAFFSEARRLFLTDTLLGYLKVEAPHMGSWELFHLDFIMERGRVTELFQLRSVSRGRHIMHLREGNFHKGFHDKFGEIATFRMFYFDSSVEQAQSTAPAEIGTSLSSTRLIEDSISNNSGKCELSVPPVQDISNIVGSAVGWHVICKKDRIPSTQPVVMYVEPEGFLQGTDSGDIILTTDIDKATKFQICQVPNENTIAFFSREHGRYLTLGGIFSNKLRIEGTKFDNWEKFKVYFDKEQPSRCYLKVMKTWPPPTITKNHIMDKADKTKATFTLLYHENHTL